MYSKDLLATCCGSDERVWWSSGNVEEVVVDVGRRSKVESVCHQPKFEQLIEEGTIFKNARDYATTEWLILKLSLNDSENGRSYVQLRTGNKDCAYRRAIEELGFCCGSLVESKVKLAHERQRFDLNRLPGSTVIIVHRSHAHNSLRAVI